MLKIVSLVAVLLQTCLFTLFYKLSDIWVKDWSDDHVVSWPGDAGEFSSLNFSYFNLPRIEQLGSFEWVNSVAEVQVTLLLPLLRASESEQVTSTTVSGSTGNCVSVCIVLSHSAFSPVQPSVDISLYQITMKK